MSFFNWWIIKKRRLRQAAPAGSTRVTSDGTIRVTTDAATRVTA